MGALSTPLSQSPCEADSRENEALNVLWSSPERLVLGSGEKEKVIGSLLSNQKEFLHSKAIENGRVQ